MIVVKVFIVRDETILQLGNGCTEWSCSERLSANL